MNNAIINKDLLTVKEMGSYLRIGTNAAYNLIHSKSFPVIKIGRSYRIPKGTFLAWVESVSNMKEGRYL